MTHGLLVGVLSLGGGGRSDRPVLDAVPVSTRFWLKCGYASPALLPCAKRNPKPAGGWMPRRPMS